jgi:membrane protease YdiL (CAAX protease family)
MPAQRYPWRIFWVLFVATTIGSIAILPYVFEVFAAKLDAETAAAPRALVVAMQILHLVLIFGIATGVGLLLAGKVGVELPYLQRWFSTTPAETRPHTVRVALIAGAMSGVFTMLLLYSVVLPLIPQFPTEAAVPLWKRLGVCIYGAINEEVLMRLFILSLVLWGLQAVARRAARNSSALFWIGNIVVALLFGAAYLPAAAAVVDLTPLAVLSIILLKGASGIVFGYLCWTRGLEAAILAHLVSDLLIHGVGPLLASS